MVRLALLLLFAAGSSAQVLRGGAAPGAVEAPETVEAVEAVEALTKVEAENLSSPYNQDQGILQGGGILRNSGIFQGNGPGGVFEGNRPGNILQSGPNSVAFQSIYFDLSGEVDGRAYLTVTSRGQARVRVVLSERGRFVCSINKDCLLYTSPSPRDRTRSRMPSSA